MDIITGCYGHRASGTRVLAHRCANTRRTCVRCVFEIVPIFRILFLLFLPRIGRDKNEHAHIEPPMGGARSHSAQRTNEQNL